MRSARRFHVVRRAGSTRACCMSLTNADRQAYSTRTYRESHHSPSHPPPGVQVLAVPPERLQVVEAVVRQLAELAELGLAVVVHALRRGIKEPMRRISDSRGAHPRRGIKGVKVRRIYPTVVAHALRRGIQGADSVHAPWMGRLGSGLPHRKMVPPVACPAKRHRTHVGFAEAWIGRQCGVAAPRLDGRSTSIWDIKT